MAVPTAEERVREINAERMKVWERAKEITDNAERAGGMAAEDKQNFDTAMKRIDEIDALRDAILQSDTAKREVETVNEELRRATSPEERRDLERRDQIADEELRSLFRTGREGQAFNHNMRVDAMTLDLSVPAQYFAAMRQGVPFNELRTYQTDTGSTGGSLTVPTTVANTIYAFMVNSNSIRRISRVITTTGGNPMSFPRVSTHSVGTQIASQTTAVTAGTAVLGNMTLSAYDYGQLAAVSNDMLEDSAVDVAGFVAEQIGRSLGIVTGVAYATGGGSGAPTGVIAAGPVGSAGTVATGGTTIAQVNAASGLVDPFIDLQYSIAEGYRPGAAFVVHNLTAGQLRKQRETGGTAGAYLWSPSPTAGLINGQPDRFLGDPIYTDANIASIASNAKIAVYGDWSAFYIRDVSGLRLERSNDLYFNLNQVAFRGILRTDSNLIDTKALNVLKMSL
jgi:HK97 family phage major capsid protein